MHDIQGTLAKYMLGLLNTKDKKKSYHLEVSCKKKKATLRE